MSFRWVTTPDFVTSTCSVCGLVVKDRVQVVLNRQRDHNPVACQRERLAKARTAGVEAEPEEATCVRGHLRDGNTHVDKRGSLVCNACRRERYASTRTTQPSTPSKELT